MNAGRDYIVEYRTTQFQQGSLVLRFDEDPSPAVLRAALIRHGVSGKSLTEVSARPLDGRAGVQRYDVSTPQERRADSPLVVLRWLRFRYVVPAFVLLCAFNAFSAGPAIEQGRQAAQEWRGEAPEDLCWDRLSLVSLASAGDEGPIGTFFSRTPTRGFSPANVAYFVACYDQARGYGDRS